MKERLYTLDEEYELYELETKDQTRYPFVAEFSTALQQYADIKRMIAADLKLGGGAALTRALEEFKIAIWALVSKDPSLFSNQKKN